MKKKGTVFFVSVAIILGVTVMSLFSGCFREKYAVDYNGEKNSYKNARDYYRAGDKVTLYYDLIATDTDYSFYLDDERINYSYDEKKGFIISFIMPDHDVSLRSESRNSMIYTPAEPEMLVDYYCVTVATDGGDGYSELVLISDQDGYGYILESYEKSDETGETCVRYLISENEADAVLDLIEELGLREWNSCEEYDSVTGVIASVKFYYKGSYIKVSSEKMPENGMEAIEKIGEALRKSIKAENVISE